MKLWHRHHEPTLSELRDIERQRAIRRYEPGLRAEARAYGLPEAEDPDPWKLIRAVHHHKDELRRPELERRAEALGLRTPKRISVTELSLAIYHEEDRLRLMRNLGITA